MTNKERQNKIRAIQAALDRNISDPFLDSSVNLQTLRPVTDAQADFHDDRFAPLDAAGNGLGSKDLKRFVSQLADDNEALQQLSQTNPDLAADIRKEKQRTFFVGDWQCVATRKSEASWRVLATNEDTGEKRQFSVAATDGSSALIIAAGFLKPRQQLWRELSDEQRLIVIRMCQQGQLADAALTYLSYALSGLLDDWHDVSSDPKYLPLTDEISWFVFTHSTPEYNESAREFVEQFCGDRPLTVGLLQTAFQAFKKHQTGIERGRLLGFNSQSEPPSSEPDAIASTIEQLEELEDSRVAELFSGVTKESARRGKFNN